MILLPLLLQAVTAPPAMPPLHGGPAPMTCPVGGETFTAWQASHYSTYGARPDGRPFSYLPFPFPLPECPTNKLVVFDEFAPADVTKLAAAIATPEYRQLVATDTSYYRGYWLATKLDRPVQALWLLLRAGWQVKGGSMADDARPTLARQYNEAFARGVAALPTTVTAEERAPLLARGANALRELGRFDEASATLARARTAFAAPGSPEPANWNKFLDKLAVVIARRDASIEPLDMIPPREAARRCRDEAAQLTATARKLCVTPGIVTAS